MLRIEFHNFYTLQFSGLYQYPFPGVPACLEHLEQEAPGRFKTNIYMIYYLEVVSYTATVPCCVLRAAGARQCASGADAAPMAMQHRIGLVMARVHHRSMH